MWDTVMGIDPITVDTSSFTWEQKRRHRRRLAKMGLSPRFAERTRGQVGSNGWRPVETRTGKTQATREMRYETEYDESIGDSGGF
jgi:hypothetical protein